ncbi:MAG TPA: hypothetical protein VF529_14755 [Solirubrobacteraceae bacterium]
MSRTLPSAARAAGAVALLAGLAAVTRLSSWRKPLATDTGQYLYIGDLVLDGGTPYTDAVNNKGPMTYVLFALIRLGAGTSMTAVRVVLLAFAVLAALALGAYVARFTDRATGAVAAAGFAVFAALPAFQGDDPNTEQIGIAFVVGSWWLATRPPARRAFAAGAAAAAAVAMNPAFAVVLPFTAWEVWRARDAAAPGGTKRLASALAGAVAVAAPLLLWLLARGALDEMWHHVVEFARGRADGSISEDAVPARSVDASGEPGAFEVPAQGFWVVGIAGLLLALTDARARRVAVPMLAWVVVGWARVKGATYEFPHHYYPVLPGLVAGLALGAARLWALTSRPRVRYAIAAVAIALPAAQWVARPERDALDVPARLRWGKEFGSFALAYPVAAFVRAHTAPGDRILVAATDPEVYWLADRRASTPYFDVFPLRRERRLVGARANDVAYDPPKAIVAMPDAEESDPWFPALLDLHEFPPAYEADGARVWLLKR